MRTYGLIGHPLSHSFSKKYFEQKFIDEKINDCEYKMFDIDSLAGFTQVLATQNLRGLNVTIPFKEQILPYLDELTAEAAEIGAVNTILISGNRLTGFNTDIKGIEKTLSPYIKQNLKALVLGTGGASKTVQYFLNKKKTEHKVVSRDKPGFISYGDIDRKIVSAYQLIINCTPLGTFPATDGFPDIPYSYLTHRHILFDLVYNPPLTHFLLKGKAQGSTILNGMKMLETQAEESLKIWQNKM
jgi:shikimate dehydrogenase